MSRDFSLFTVAFGDGIVVVSSLVVGEALDDDEDDDGDVVDADEDDDEPDGVGDGVADDDDELGEGDDDIADDEDDGDDDGVDVVAELDDGVVDVDDDVVDDGGVTSVLRWQPEAAASARAAVRTRGIDRRVMRISGYGRPRRAAPNAWQVAGSVPCGIHAAARPARLVLVERSVHAPRRHGW